MSEVRATAARCVDLSCDRVGKFAVFGGREICPPAHAGEPVDLDAEYEAAVAEMVAREEGVRGGERG